MKCTNKARNITVNVYDGLPPFLYGVVFYKCLLTSNYYFNSLNYIKSINSLQHQRGKQKHKRITHLWHQFLDRNTGTRFQGWSLGAPWGIQEAWPGEESSWYHALVHRICCVPCPMSRPLWPQHFWFWNEILLALLPTLWNT